MGTKNDPRVWMLSKSGKELDLENPKVEDVDWNDIGEALAKTCRYGGHCRGFYSVARHSINVARLLKPEMQIYGILHDAHESWTGDIIQPMKQLLGYQIKQIERRIDPVIFEAAGIPKPSDQVRAAVKAADLTMLATERRDLMAHLPDSTPWAIDGKVEPASFQIVPNGSWQRDFTDWLAWLNDCMNDDGSTWRALE